MPMAKISPSDISIIVVLFGPFPNVWAKPQIPCVLVVVFNDPVPVDNPALQAVLMALEMRDAIGALTERWRRLGHDIGFGIGIAHGFATLGTIGFEGRFDYAAIGTRVQCRLSPLRRSQARSNTHQSPCADGGRGRRHSRAGGRVCAQGHSSPSSSVQCTCRSSGWIMLV